MISEGLEFNGCVVARKGDTWPIGNIAYRGVCRGHWWPLSEDTDRDPEAKELTETLDLEFLNRAPENQAPNSSADLAFLRRYVRVCERLGLAPLYCLLCASEFTSESSPQWLAEFASTCCYLGVDITYSSGSYSFINEGCFGQDSQLRFFLDANLNDNGLFDTVEQARSFLLLHQGALDRGLNLETLDGAIVVALWADFELANLRQYFERNDIP